jgi:galactokinase
VTDEVVAFAPGRVNLIGDHTDYTGGLVLPMAIDLGTTVRAVAGGDSVQLDSADEAEEATVPLTCTDPTALTPAWARYVGGVVAELQPTTGLRGSITTTLPIGSGLSSSAALELAVALALGFVGTPLELAKLCQRAEQRSSGVPCGIMDQLASASGIEGHALLIDCHTLSIDPVPVPSEAEVVVVHSGQQRTLAGSAYADRRAQCEAAEEVLGPLRLAQHPDVVEVIADPNVRRRARHVISENGRVRAAAAALAAGDLVEVGRQMIASHASLRDDFEVSTPALDALVERLCAADGVFGARLTGAGFGGCVVALTTAGALDEGWRVRASQGARRSVPPSR